jgi:hypothetical protein
MFFDKFIKKKPDQQPVVEEHHELRDEDPKIHDDIDILEITGEYAHWYMLYGKGYTIYQDTDYIYKELLRNSYIGKSKEKSQLDIELIINGELVYKGTSSKDKLFAKIGEMIALNKDKIISYGYQPDSKLIVQRIK